MALLYVLWACALFALFAQNFVDASHTLLQAARGRAAQAEAQATADGALALGLLAVLDRDPGRVALGARLLDLPGGQAVLTVEDEGGRVDLNRAPPALLAALFRAAGADDPPALVAAVLARRARMEPLKRPGFALPDELGQLPGITPALLARLAPAVTTVSRSEVVDPAVAGALALGAATGFAPESARAFMVERAQLGRFARPRGVPEGAPIGALTGAGFTLHAEASRGDAMAARTLLLRPVPFAGRMGVAVLDWRTPQVAVE
jgi:general secretion pathway protein K